MIQSMFILSPTGEVLIERHFRGTVTSRRVCETFWDRASLSVNHHGGISSNLAGNSEQQHYDTVPPVMEVPAEDSEQGTLYVISVLRDGLSYLAVCPAEVSPLLVLEFLHRVASIFVDYFGPPADEAAIKDNFSTVYQLLEEMVDYGWPLTTEPNALKAMIRPPTVMSKLFQQSSTTVSDELPSGTVSNMPWRASGVHYSNNEIYIDIVEEVDAIINASGAVVSSDVSGSIQCQSHLSGIPDLLLTFKDPTLIDDCSFHPCVRYGRFEQEHLVSFVPPDGDFELMRYRIRPDQVRNFYPPVYCRAQCTYLEQQQPTSQPSTTTASSAAEQHMVAVVASPDVPTKTGRIVLQAGVASLSSLIFSASATAQRKGPLQVEDVVISLPFSKKTRTTSNFRCNIGHVFYDESRKVAKWTLGTMDATQKATLSCTFTVATKAKSKKEVNNKGDSYNNYNAEDDEDEDDDDDTLSSPNLSLSWKIPLASVSGLSVSGLSITREQYRPYKGVRNITKSGLFQVRSR